MKKILQNVLIFAVMTLPLLSFAQINGLSGSMVQNLNRVANDPSASCFERFRAGGKVGDLLNYATCLIQSTVIPLIFALALAIFVWGVVQFVINSDDEAKKDKGKQFMMWGIIGLTVMVSVWGLVKILGNTFGVDTSVLPSVKPN